MALTPVTVYSSFTSAETAFLTTFADSGGNYNSIIYIETPSGDIDGVNKTYTTVHDGNLVIFLELNGQFIHPADYTYSGHTITFGTALPIEASGLQFTVAYSLNLVGGSATILDATGAVDNSNLIFTFASTPTIVVVNGSSYRNGHGVTISSLTATLDSPVGTGGDIYGLS